MGHGVRVGLHRGDVLQQRGDVETGLVAQLVDVLLGLLKDVIYRDRMPDRQGLANRYR